MIQFYSPDIAESRKLPADESGHCCRVLRKTVGDEIRVVDGKGFAYECRITKADPRGVEVEILSREALPAHWDTEITIAVAPTKSADRMEWFVEKAVEIGVDHIVMLQCARSERKRINIDRLHRIAVSAMKQSLKAKLPEMEEVKFRDFIGGTLPGQRLMAYCGDKCERADLSQLYDPARNVVLLIGPEGDFSPEEVDAAIAAGFRGVTFGRNRLRTETAALYGLVALHVLESSKNNTQQ